MSEPSTPFEKAVRYASVSDVGMRRKNNQDSKNLLVSSDEEFWKKRGHLFVVADGMGAHAAGELASKLATDSIPHVYSKDLEKDPITALHHAVITANTTIYQRGQAESEFTGMGTTCSTLLLLPEGAVIAHVGDSRIYRLRKGQFEQLTFDHSLVWEMEAAGKLSGSDTDLHFPKNIITRSLGPSPKVQIDIEGPFPISPGDIFLLCSDGLSGQVSDLEMGAILSSLPPAEAAQLLVDLANLRGGPDNITVVIAQVDHPPVAQTDNGSVEESPPKSRLNIIVLLAFLLIAAVCFALERMQLLENLYLAAIAGIGAVVTAIVTLLQHFEKSATETVPATAPQPLGRGPYRTYACNPTQETVDNFSGISAELRKSVEQIGTEVDWPKFDEYVGDANLSAQKGEFTDSTYHHCQGISFLVAALKSNKESLLASDSHIDLI
ncbi:MAG: protein phosphatase 2C domain-containing protein [Pirellulales bacterium]|nr:protein phosphatase 2C domain-containing protein [Pirellulales bacterium]